MNLTFLGDALDHWKGSLFESLQKGGILQDFAVDAMASDAADWAPADSALYAKLLRIEQRQVVSHKESLTNRQGYFAEIKHGGDLFLDPDTGIATGKPSKKHLAPSELATLLESGHRVVAVYQHVRGVRVCDRVDAVCAVVQRASPGVQWFSYESGTVAMVFFGTAPKRLEDVHGHFNTLLGRPAAGRMPKARRSP